MNSKTKAAAKTAKAMAKAQQMKKKKAKEARQKETASNVRTQIWRQAQAAKKAAARRTEKSLGRVPQPPKIAFTPKTIEDAKEAYQPPTSGRCGGRGGGGGGGVMEEDLPPPTWWQSQTQLPKALILGGGALFLFRFLGKK